MRRPGVFQGPIVTDLLTWAGGGLIVGGMFGYALAEISNRIQQPTNPKDPVWVGNRDAYRGAIFCFLVAASGHMLRAIF